MRRRLKSWQKLVITGALSALGGAIVTTWIPNLATNAYERIIRDPRMVVQVEHEQRPVSGVKLAVSRGSGGNDVLASGTTNENGIVELYGVDIGLFLVKATLCEGASEQTYTHVQKIDSLPYYFPLDVAQFTDPSPAVCSTPPPVVSTLSIENLEVTSRRTYFTATLQDKSVVYTDRDYRYTKVPSFLMGKTYIITANDDKFGGRDFEFLLKFNVNREVVIYVAHSDDYTNKPSWLSSFQDTNADLVFTVNNQEIILSLYKKRFPAGQIVLGGNVISSETENHAMYTVIVSEN
jgi:hypothetical protein